MQGVLLAPVERVGVLDVVRGGGRAIAHDRHIAGGGRVVGVEGLGRSGIGRIPVAHEYGAIRAGHAEPRVACGDLPRAGVDRQRALDLPDGLEPIAERLLAANTKNGPVVGQPRSAAQVGAVGRGGG